VVLRQKRHASGADAHTERYTDIHTLLTTLCTPPGGEVISK